MPPPGDMYGPGPYLPMERDRHRDDYRGRGPPPRRSYPSRDHRDRMDSGRYSNDENRAG